MRKRAYNPMMRVAILMNQYHSIDMMEGTKDEKQWAKKRLLKRVLKACSGLSPRLVSEIKSSTKSKYQWEYLKNQYLD